MKKAGKASRKSKKAPKQETPIQRFQSQNLRLTREIDALGTIVAAQGELIGKIYLALQEKRIMSYEPIYDLTSKPPVNVVGPGLKTSGFQKNPLQPERKDSKKVEAEVRQERVQPQMSPSIAFSTQRQYEFSVRAKIQETTVGWLSEDGKWTLEPNKIVRFGTKEEAAIAMQKAEPPKGAKPVIEAQGTF
jgi:hypothetical protein